MTRPWATEDEAVSEAGDLLDEKNHLTLLNRSRVVLVELPEALVEVIVVEAGAISHVGQRVLNEALGLLFVEEVIAIVIVFAPNLVDALGDDAIDLGVAVGHLCF